VEGVELAALRTLLNDLFAQNPFETARLIEAIRWELPSELEEIAYRFRAARLADLGFPALYEAMHLFSYVKVESPLPRRGEGQGEGGLAPSRGHVDYVEAAFKGLDNSERD